MIVGPAQEAPNYLLDEIRNTPLLSSVPADVDIAATLGQVANVLDDGDDSHWDGDKPSVQFFNEGLKGTGVRVGRAEIDAYLPGLTRQVKSK